MKGVKWYITVVLALAIIIAGVQIVRSDFKSTFLINGAEYSTLSWLAPDNSEDKWTFKTLEYLINNGDTHADVMARSTADDFGKVTSVNRAAWRHRLKILNDKGITPIMWLISDDSQDVYKKGLSNQIAYQKKVVEATDDMVSHYVACLECNEYYSPQEVSVLIQNLRKETDKPIGVHLTPGVRPAYYKSADIIYLQIGFNKSEAQMRAMIEEALKVGKPVVVSEYHLKGTSAEARRMGDIACEYASRGVVGTGNGRGASVCGSLETTVEKSIKWTERYEDELSVLALVIVTMSATMALDLPFEAYFNYANEDGYEVMLAAPIDENKTVGMTYDNRGRIFGFIQIAFDRLFGDYRGAGREERK